LFALPPGGGCVCSERALLAQSLESITHVNRFVNEAKARAERYAKLFELQNTIWGENVVRACVP